MHLSHGSCSPEEHKFQDNNSDTKFGASSKAATHLYKTQPARPRETRPVTFILITSFGLTACFPQAGQIPQMTSWKAHESRIHQVLLRLISAPEV
jgi:hypothetical protein